MIDNYYLTYLPSHIKMLVGTFLIVLSVGYFSGLFFVNSTTQMTDRGIIENYNGNEYDEDASVMKFRKSEHEMINVIHTHILSMSLIFFLLGILIAGAKCPPRLKLILMIEPLLSVLITFGGIYFVWLGVEWMSYAVMISGVLMTTSFLVSIVVIFSSLRVNIKCLERRVD